MSSNPIVQPMIYAIQSGVPGIQLHSHEYLRSDKLIQHVADALAMSQIKEWNLSDGWVDFKNKRSVQEYDINPPSLYTCLKELDDLNLDNVLIVVKNAQKALAETPATVARLQQLLLRIQRHHRGVCAVMLCTETTFQYEELQGLCHQYQLKPLFKSQIKQLVERFIKQNGCTTTTEVKNQFVSLCIGLELEVIEQLLSSIKVQYQKKFDARALKLVKEVKEQIITNSGLLEVISMPNQGSVKLAGLDNLTLWLDKKRRVIERSENQEKYGLPAPKGVLLAGIPGCGKSLSAKLVAEKLQYPLFRLDLGRLMGKYVGESEKNMREALNLADQASPCVLWIDEIEKAFSGIGGSGGNGEITTRLLGLLLTWMQEKSSTTFVIATANNIKSLPSELLRKGRFDDIFYVDFPNCYEREQILSVHLQGKPISHIDLKVVAKQTELFSGSDLETLVNTALESAFLDNCLLSNQNLLNAVKEVIPLGKQNKHQLDELKTFFLENNFKPASYTEAQYQQLADQYQHTDPMVRKQVASNHFTSAQVLSKLADDNDLLVRESVLKNHNCPVELLTAKISNFKGTMGFDFTQSGVWSNSNPNEMVTTRREFEAALHHPNLKLEQIELLYRTGNINKEDLLALVEERGYQAEFKTLCQRERISLPKTAASGIVRKIYCHQGQLLKVGDMIFEYDNAEGNSETVVCHQSGLIEELSIGVSQRLYSGDTIMQLITIE
ncbi:AAA family ATPase [Vibrio cyclitrophicus]|uniref:AAA family ATPase n=1 Tax=Vibrio cyclitrophicus TaxID=47951 RepID=UPI0021C30AC7|nr:AAA family ATPase [Vibrio cyclitrophicus]